MQGDFGRYSAGTPEDERKCIGTLRGRGSQGRRTRKNSDFRGLLQVEIDADNDLRFDWLAAERRGTIPPLTDRR